MKADTQRRVVRLVIIPSRKPNAVVCSRLNTAAGNFRELSRLSLYLVEHIHVVQKRLGFNFIGVAVRRVKYYVVRNNQPNKNGCEKY